jgi:hypothetical protein
LKTGFSNTRLDLKKNTKYSSICNFKKIPQKIGLAADKNSRAIEKNIPRKNKTGGSRIDIFCCSPTSSASGGGRLCQGVKRNPL